MRLLTNAVRQHPNKLTGEQEEAGVFSTGFMAATQSVTGANKACLQ